MLVLEKRLRCPLPQHLSLFLCLASDMSRYKMSVDSLQKEHYLRFPRSGFLRSKEINHFERLHRAREAFHYAEPFLIMECV